MDAIGWRNRLIAVVRAHHAGDPDPLGITAEQIAEIEAKAVGSDGDASTIAEMQKKLEAAELLLGKPATPAVPSIAPSVPHG